MNLRTFEEKLRQPVVTLGLLVALQLSGRLGYQGLWFSYVKMVVWLWIIDGALRSLSRSKTSTATSNPRRWGLGWRLLAYLTTPLIVFGVILYQQLPNIVADNVSSQPLQAIASVGDAEVLLGADEILIYQESGIKQGTVSFYTPEGLAVGMAHAVPDMEPGPWPIGLRSPGYFDRQSAQLLANSEDGIVFKLDYLPETARQKLLIGGPDDITVGGVAQLHSVKGGSFPVRILGYDLHQGIQTLLIQPLDSEHEIIPGMSGSPIVQNGKLIACARAVYGVPHRGPAIAQARLAADIYAASLRNIGDGPNYSHFTSQLLPPQLHRKSDPSDQ